jgi:hypothetical protein
MKWFAWGCLMAICLPVSGGTLVEQRQTAAMVEKYDSALDGSGDTVLSRAFVPSVEKRHGEVRLVRRDDGLVVQTLLYSKLLKRVVARIGEKERMHWPPQRDGHRDALGYIDALGKAQLDIAERFRDRANNEDRRQKMLIEFICQPAAALVAIYELRMEEIDGEPRITGKRPIAIIEPSRHYVLENMKLIVADSLNVPDDESEALFHEIAAPGPEE